MALVFPIRYNLSVVAKWKTYDDRTILNSTYEYVDFDSCMHG